MPTPSTFQLIVADTGAAYSYVGLLAALSNAAVAISNLFEQFRLQGWARFMIAKDGNGL